MTAARRIVIDTDPGLGEPGSDIDDGLAIALALRSPELTVEALTVVNGNVDVDTGVDVARRLTRRLGHPDLPVLRGADRPLLRDMAPLRALFDDVVGDRPAVPTAADDRLGPTSDLTAAAYLVELAAANPGEITVVAIGPMTNLALALRLDPGFARNVAEIVMMAGSATGYAQNITVVGDFNAYVDPEALAMVLASGARLRMVGIDQTSRVRLTRDDAAALSAVTPSAAGPGSARWPGSISWPGPSRCARNTGTRASCTTPSWWRPSSTRPCVRGPRPMSPPTPPANWPGAWSWPTADSPSPHHPVPPTPRSPSTPTCLASAISSSIA